MLPGSVYLFQYLTDNSYLTYSYHSFSVTALASESSFQKPESNIILLFSPETCNHISFLPLLCLSTTSPTSNLYHLDNQNIGKYYQSLVTLIHSYYLLQSLVSVSYISNGLLTGNYFHPYSADTCFNTEPIVICLL